MALVSLIKKYGSLGLVLIVNISPVYFFLPLLVLAAAALPLWEYFNWEGIIAYTNGLDEGSYLQYDFSQVAASLTQRRSQYLVTTLHELGFSGGYINLIFDLICPALIIFLSYRLLLTLTEDRRFAQWGSVLWWLLPLLLTPANPILDYFWAWVIRSESLAWMSMPETHEWFLLRSPEPQFSYVIGLIALLSWAKWRNLLPLLLVIPLLYSFVAMGWLFLTVLIALGSMKPPSRVILSYLLISIPLSLYLNFGVPSDTRGLLLASHLPLVSFCGLLGIGLYKTISNKITNEQRPIALSLAISPWLAANQQLISGWISVPSNCEQYFGTIAISALIVWWFYLNQKILRHATLALVMLWLLVVGQRVRHSLELARRFPITPQVIQNLSTGSQFVAVADVEAANVFGLALPRQPQTLLAYSRSYLGFAKESISNYRCFKAQKIDEPSFTNAFRQLDVAFAYETEDYFLNTLFRRERGPPHFDLSPSLSSCSKRHNFVEVLPVSANENR